MYLAVKHIHLTLVAISVAFLLLRFFWSWRESPLMQARWVKVLPHVVDTCLLLMGLVLCFIIAQYPFVDQWLTEKFFSLFMYIALGVMALKARTKWLRSLALVGALSWLAVMAKLAVTKQPWLF